MELKLIVLHQGAKISRRLQREEFFPLGGGLGVAPAPVLKGLVNSVRMSTFEVLDDGDMEDEDLP